MKTIGNQVVMPLNVAKMIDENDPVFKMADILSELDYRKLRGTYRRRWRSISPEIMFSIVVYANMKGIYSSRGIGTQGLSSAADLLLRQSVSVHFYNFRVHSCIAVCASSSHTTRSGPRVPYMVFSKE